MEYRSSTAVTIALACPDSFKIFIRSSNKTGVFFQAGALAGSGKRTIRRRKLLLAEKWTAGSSSLFSLDLLGVPRIAPERLASCGSFDVNWTSPTSTMLEMSISGLPMGSPMTEVFHRTKKKLITVLCPFAPKQQIMSAAFQISNKIQLVTHTKFRPRIKGNTDTNISSGSNRSVLHADPGLRRETPL